MKCQVCGEAEATIHFKDVKNDEVHELHLCSACAEEKGYHPTIEQGAASMGSNFVWLAENVFTEGSGAVGAVQCGHCGTRYSEFTRHGRLGCPDCYAAFDVQIRRLLRRVHGATRHVGKTPGRPAAVTGRRAALNRLREELQRAVASEDYERAARLRDEIRAVQAAEAAQEPRN